MASGASWASGSKRPGDGRRATGGANRRRASGLCRAAGRVSVNPDSKGQVGRE